MDILYPQILIVSNKFDFSSDFIALELRRRNLSYLRINRDELKDYQIWFNPVLPRIDGTYNNQRFCISSESLKTIYFRAPTFLRDIYQDGVGEEEQLNRTQWAAFVRSLCVFEDIKWMNNPVDIYKAEIKPYQLFLANKIGFKIPDSLISNSINDLSHDVVAIKSIDTAIISMGDNEGFVYTEIYKKSELGEAIYSSPFFIQQGLVPKTDIRVTVVDSKAIAIKIFQNDQIDIDWRKRKDELKYEVIDLPKDIYDLCILFTKSLNLTFGGIDLIKYDDDYYFIEINPTGEWSWLQQNTNYRLDKLIVDALQENF